MNTTGKHRGAWSMGRFRNDFLGAMLVATGKRVDLTKGYRK